MPAEDFDPKRISLDLSDDDCERMTRFVAGLPTPIVSRVGAAGRGLAIFAAIGCATCHAPSVGNVRGLYSDLLLHDLGDRVRAFGGYGSTTSQIVDNSPGGKGVSTPSSEPGPAEWRTAPLWGVADSAPYLHDGRAPTLHEAILLHGGEAELTTKRYRLLSHGDRQALLAFLHSQVAPSQPRRPAEKSVRTARVER